MRVSKKAILTALLGLMLSLSAAGMAQTTAQTDQKKNSESCCSMDSCCCCNGGSCDMKAKHDAKNHKSDDNKCCKMKQKNAK
ncbi:MAG TPA: hypothetical protein VEV42_08065 [Pyrinomonadaceae bacterium]|nr:hypothetical protein [Pyrinomonadaceae bacterium]